MWQLNRQLGFWFFSHSFNLFNRIYLTDTSKATHDSSTAKAPHLFNSKCYTCAFIWFSALQTCTRLDLSSSTLSWEKTFPLRWSGALWHPEQLINDVKHEDVSPYLLWTMACSTRVVFSEAGEPDDFWLITDRNCSSSLVLSVFPAPDSPLQYTHNTTTHTTNI